MTALAAPNTLGELAERPFARVVARLDIKGDHLVKGVHLEGLRKVGKPAARALRYYEQGIDEVIYMDIVASLYGRNSLDEVVARTAAEIFVPLTVGGGIRTLDDVTRLLRSGADKVAINTAALRRPELLREAARAFGSQCIVLSVEAKRQPDGRWEAYTDNGRERSGLDAIDWIKRGVDLGAGEVLLTSVDREGTKRGLDLDLIAAVAPVLCVPLVVSGGAGQAGHVAEGFAAGADAVAVANLLHYDTMTVEELKGALGRSGREVRP